jgi:hypothetical protein
MAVALAVRVAPKIMVPTVQVVAEAVATLAQPQRQERQIVAVVVVAKVTETTIPAEAAVLMVAQASSSCATPTRAPSRSVQV